jgi:biotin operon repressor
MRYQRSTAILKRHQELLALIEQGAYSSPRLAKDLGVSEQTVYRDILFLKRQGYQIRSVRLPTNWAYRLLAQSNQGRRAQTGAV